MVVPDSVQAFICSELEPALESLYEDALEEYLERLEYIGDGLEVEYSCGLSVGVRLAIELVRKYATSYFNVTFSS